MPNTIKILACIMAVGSFQACHNDKKVLPVIESNTSVSEPKLPEWITLSYIMGQFNPEEHPDFVLVDRQYADREGMMLRKEAYAAFQQMSAAAQNAGHKMVIRSATRNFDYQKGIWQRKWSGATLLEGGISGADIADPVARAQKILLYSSMPGTSRHHWGTDIDINSFDNTYFRQGAGGALYDWMVEHAASYGYCQPYSDKQHGRTGYEEEKWHWSYMPLSQSLTAYSKQHMRNELIRGFEGSEVAPAVNMVDNYILGINPNCLP